MNSQTHPEKKYEKKRSLLQKAMQQHAAHATLSLPRHLVATEQAPQGRGAHQQLGIDPSGGGNGEGRVRVRHSLLAIVAPPSSHHSHDAAAKKGGHWGAHCEDSGAVCDRHAKPTFQDLWGASTHLVQDPPGWGCTPKIGPIEKNCLRKQFRWVAWNPYTDPWRRIPLWGGRPQTRPKPPSPSQG